MKKSYAKKLGLCVALALSVGVLLPTGMVEANQSKFIYTTAIKGNMTDDMDYVKTGVLDTATNTYNFIKNETTITAENSTVSGGPWVGRVGSAVAGIDDTTTLDMHGHTLTVREANAGHSTGITAIGTRGKVEINNAGAMDISASGTGQTAALFVNGLRFTMATATRPYFV